MAGLIGVIVRGTIAVFVVGFASYVFMPVMYDMAYQLDYWDTAPANQIVIRDQLYNIFLILPLFMIGSIVLWGYLNATRTSATEYA